MQLRLKIQQFSTVVWCYVTDLCKEFDIILGNTFMTEHNAVLNYPCLTVSLTRHGKRFTLKAGRKTEFATESKLFLNCAQARRSLKNGCEAFLVMVNAFLNETDTDASSDVTCAADVTNTDTENLLADGITSLRHQYADIFEPPKGLPPDRGIEHVISTLPDAQPPVMRMYRLSPAELAEVKSQVQDLLGRGLIEPSTSAYGAPILFVKKKTGELRTVVDYRALNKLTVKNRYPLPRIDDLFDKMHGAQYFTGLDAASGFHQILLKPGDRPKTAFRTPFGHYQFKVLPFGLTNAPATFQTVMNKLFNQAHFDANGAAIPGELLSDFVLVFIDDILIFSKTAEDHQRHLRIVCELLRKEKLQIKPSKCVWGKAELPYLGCIVRRDGIKPDPKKVEAVTAWPTPTTVKEINNFLGLTNFFSKFMLGYCNLAAPMTELTKKKVETRALIARAKRSMFAAQQRQKRYHDNNRTDKQFAVGDQVLLSTANLALKILRNGTRKLAPKWVGPFTVTERVGSLGYRLEVPDAMLVHDVFHVCYLRGYKNDLRKAPPPVPELDDEGEQNWEVDAVLDHKEYQQGRKRKLKYLLRFTGYGPEEDLWTDDVSDCNESVQDYWDKKFATKRLHAAVCVTFRGTRS